jgi:predicted nucleic acid-binding protein
MKTLFVDTSYWVARSNRRDQWHQNARALGLQFSDASLLTSELVLVEYSTISVLLGLKCAGGWLLLLKKFWKILRFK